MISFGAKYISPVTINKIGKNKELSPYGASLVELNPKSRKDILSLSLTANFLPKRTGFAGSILEDFAGAVDGVCCNKKNLRFFAITEGQESYEYVRPNNILGLAEISTRNLENCIFLEYLQAVRGLFVRRYSHVGTKLLNYIKELHPDKDIELRALSSSVKFYKINGFEPVNKVKTDSLTTMRYSPKKKKTNM